MQEKQKLISEIQPTENQRKKVMKAKPKPKPKLKQKRIKTFDDDFVECIRNKTIPKDTPAYLFREQ